MKKPRPGNRPPMDTLRRAEAIVDTSNDERIYVVVADTVQDSMGMDLSNTLYRVPSASTIRQVPGRIVAQVGHVVSLTRLKMAERCLQYGMSNIGDEYMGKVWTALATPITTIVLSCRDSFELHHVYRLLESRPSIRVHAFHDENPEVYGTTRKILTAIATEPISRLATEGVLDYLPLWKPVQDGRG